MPRPQNGISDEQLAKWRAEFEARFMTSDISEYCPEEFGELLDEVVRLRRLVASMLAASAPTPLP
jgi:hypothetical protein